MLLIKLIAPFLIGIISIIQFILEFKWSDKRTNKHKRTRRYLPLLITLITVATIFLVIDENANSNKLEEDLKALRESSEEEKRMIKDNASLSVHLANKSDSISKSKISELKLIMKPFVRIANQSYPELETNAALYQLANELESVREIATKDVFKPFPTKKKDGIQNDLDQLYKHFGGSPKIKFNIQQGTSNNDKVIDDLATLLNQAGFTTEISYGLYPRTDVAYSWEIHLLSKHAKLADYIMRAIAPYIQPKFGIAQRDHKEWLERQGEFPEGEIDIFIYTSPSFKNNGEVYY